MCVATRQYRNLELSDCVSMILRINGNISLRVPSGVDAIIEKIMVFRVHEGGRIWSGRVMHEVRMQPQGTHKEQLSTTANGDE